MAKKVRFPLQMNGEDVRTIEELREHFDLESVLGYFANGKLVIWLRNHYYDKEANAIEALSNDDEKLTKKLCGILKVTYAEETSEIDMAFIKRRQEKMVLLRQFTSEECLISNIDVIAFNQKDLCDILNNEKEKTIYLCNGEFEINLIEENIHYIGIGNPVVFLVKKEDEEVYNFNIKFTNIQRIETNNAHIQYLLGNCYASGNGFVQNWYKALEWFEKSAAQGIAASMYELGQHKASCKEWNSAIEWYQKAIDNGFEKAKDALISMYLEAGMAYEIKEEWNNAMNCFQKAADNGSNEATQRIIKLCLSLGKKYEEKKDWDKSISYYNIACGYDSSTAKEFYSALCIRIGKKYNKEKCWEKSVDYFCKAAKFGDCSVILKIARYYDSIGKSEISINWYKLAAEHGDSTSQKILEKLGVSW